MRKPETISFIDTLFSLPLSVLLLRRCVLPFLLLFVVQFHCVTEWDTTRDATLSLLREGRKGTDQPREREKKTKKESRERGILHTHTYPALRFSFPARHSSCLRIPTYTRRHTRVSQNINSSKRTRLNNTSQQKRGRQGRR